MKIRIIRYRQKRETLDGRIFIDGKRVCDCAENTYSALKPGTYNVVISRCKQYGRKMPVVLINGEEIKGTNKSKELAKCAHCKEIECVNFNTMMPCKCPQIKPGNGVYKREDSSIIVGTYVAPGCLTRPKLAFDALYDRIRKAIGRGHKITLVIEDDFQIERNIFSNFGLGLVILEQMGGRKFPY